MYTSAAPIPPDLNSGSCVDQPIIEQASLSRILRLGCLLKCCHLQTLATGDYAGDARRSARRQPVRCLQVALKFEQAQYITEHINLLQADAAMHCPQGTAAAAAAAAGCQSARLASASCVERLSGGLQPSSSRVARANHCGARSPGDSPRRASRWSCQCVVIDTLLNITIAFARLWARPLVQSRRVRSRLCRGRCAAAPLGRCLRGRRLCCFQPPWTCQAIRLLGV
jgi:hypothetical protein